MIAGFLNNMPLILDELQVVSNKNGYDDVIYQLCEGVGRIRGHKGGGVQDMLTWSNTILTTGEQPITNAQSSSFLEGTLIAKMTSYLKTHEN